MYFCYELDEEGRISRRHEVEAENDEDAIVACRKTAVRFEVWLGSRLVYGRSRSSGPPD
jgi:hypothetical protein